MSEPTIVAPSGGPANGSAWSRIWGALTAPTETFTSLAARPTFAVALVALLVVGIAVGWVALGKVTPESFLQSIEDAGRPVPPALRDNPEAFISKMQLIQTVAAAVIAAIFYLAAAGLFVVLFRLVGSELTYRQSLATTVHGLLPLGVAAIVGLVVLAGRSEVSLSELQSGSLLASNLGFLAGEETSKAVRTLLTSFDLFTLWSLYLLALGYRIVARVSTGAAWGVVVVLWGLGVGVKVVLASIF